MTANTTQTLTRPERKAPEPKAPEHKAPEHKAPEHKAPEHKAPEHQAPERPAVIAGTRPSRDSSAGDVVLAYLRTQAHTLKTLEPAVRGGEFDSVHQMRVATRRLRAVLRTFGQVIPRTDSEHLAAELQWLGRELGAARDADVLAGHLRDSLRPTPPELLIGPVQARVQGHFAPLRAAARANLIEALDSPRYTTLLAELDRVAAGPPRGPLAGAPAREVLPAAVRRAYRQAKRRMRTARHTPDGPARDAALHQARKSARRTRYAAEAANPAIGKKARKFAKQMKHVQSVLGDHHDAVLARQAARDLGIGAYLAGENAFTYGLLYERELHHAERLQTRASKVWGHAARPKHRRWMN